MVIVTHTYVVISFKIEEAANFLVIFTSHTITYYDTKWLSFLLTRIKLTFDSWDWCKLRKYRNRKVFFLSHLLYRWRKMLRTLNGNPYIAYCIFPSAVWLDDHLTLIFTEIISNKKSIDTQLDVEQFFGWTPMAKWLHTLTFFKKHTSAFGIFGIILSLSMPSTFCHHFDSHGDIVQQG